MHCTYFCSTFAASNIKRAANALVRRLTPTATACHRSTGANVERKKEVITKKLVATVIQHTNMNKKTLAAALATIAAANPAGYTVNARTLEPLTSGYAVAVAATQNSFGPEGLERVIEYANTHEDITAFGGWLDDKSGLYYYDAVIICQDRTGAMELARVNKQIAFFDLANVKEIRL